MSRHKHEEVIILSSSDEDEPGRQTHCKFLEVRKTKTKTNGKAKIQLPRSLQHSQEKIPLTKTVYSDNDDEDDLLDIDCLPAVLGSQISLESFASKSPIKTYNDPATTGKRVDSNELSNFNSQRSWTSGQSGGVVTSGESQQSVQSNSSGKSRKELLKEESERKKEEKRVERERKEAQLLRERELKKSENELRKNSRPGEAHKFMTILIDGSLPRLSELIQVLDAAGFNHETNFNPLVKNSFIFRREIIFRAMGNDLNLHKVSKFEEENQIMILLEHEEIVPKLAIQISDGPVPGYEDDIDFLTFIKSISASVPLKKITLFLFGMENYFKKLAKNTQQEFRQRVLNGDQEKRSRKKKIQLPVISRLEFQSALVQLQLETNINFRLVNNINELGVMLIQYLKAIAEAPFKQQRKEQGFDWYAAADTAGSVKVEKDGKGLKRLWIEQLCLFNGVAIDTAQAISTKYPSPQHLIQAYAKCDTQDEGETLIRDLNVRMGVGPLAKTRKIGPELSKKMYRFFTSSDAERNLGSSQNI